MGSRALQLSVLAMAVATGLATAGCSSAGSQTAAKLIPQVQAAAMTATSVHVAGAVAQGKNTATFDVSFSGSAVDGTVGVNGQTVHVLVLNGATYVKVDAAFLNAEHAPPSVCAKVCGKYVELPAVAANQVTSFLNMQTLITEVFKSKDINSGTGGGCIFSPATRHGQSVLKCSQGPYTLEVAAHGKPYIAYYSGPHGEHLAFSGWNAVAPPSAPPASQVVSENALG